MGGMNGEPTSPEAESTSSSATHQGAGAHVRRQPVWSYFLTPAAILIGAVIIAGAVWFTRDDDGSAPQRAADVQDEGGGASTLPDQAGSQQATLVGALTGYAEEIGLDVEQFGQCMNTESVVDILNTHVQRGRNAGVTGTPTFIVNNKKIVGAQPLAVLNEVIEAELTGGPDSVDAYSATIQQLAAAGRFEILAADFAVDIADADVEGSPAAKVVVAEFSDFQCPFCQAWVEQSLSGIRERVGDDVALAFLHFPIQQIHPNAVHAHVAAACADRQDAFWPMHDLLFERQDEWKDLPR